jgi:drug/metabolite transporter (DMT)-like permease
MEEMFFLISVLTIFGGFSVAILAIVSDHKQKMLLIEKGLIEEKKALPGLRSGLVFSFLGAILLLIFWEWRSILGIIPWYSAGGILLAFGLAQLIYFMALKRESKRPKRERSVTTI